MKAIRNLLVTVAVAVDLDSSVSDVTVEEDNDTTNGASYATLLGSRIKTAYQNGTGPGVLFTGTFLPEDGTGGPPYMDGVGSTLVCDLAQHNLVFPPFGPTQFGFVWDPIAPPKIYCAYVNDAEGVYRALPPERNVLLGNGSQSSPTRARTGISSAPAGS